MGEDEPKQPAAEATENAAVATPAFTDEEKAVIKSALSELRVNPNDVDAAQAVSVVQGILAKL